MTALTENTLEISVVRSTLKKDYEVFEELGRGGMAIVYRAREKALDRDVAIKILPAALTIDAEFVERFQREAKTAGQLEHPNIVPIYRVGRSGQVIYFVMKLLSGQSLAAVANARGKLSAQELRRVLLETASALSYASKKGVVHRDIKPDNILLDSEGRCVVTDFGIAKRSDSQMTAQGQSMGTPRYMSPEHAQGIPVDGRSDIYSLGVVAYRCLVGTLPFDGEDPFAVLYKHINSPVPQPTLESEEDRVLFAIIEKMLAKKPEDRYQTADELIVALGGQISQPTLIAATISRVSRLTPTELMATPQAIRLLDRVPRDWRLWAAAAGIVVVAGGSYLAMSSSDAVASDSARDTTTPTATLAGAPTTPALLPTQLPPAVVVAPKRVVAAVREPFSRCARTPRDFALLVDSIRSQKQGTKQVTLNYDVCGLPAGAAFQTWIKLSKDQGRFRGRMEPVELNFLDDAIGPRTRRQRSISVAGLSTGKYAIEISVVDKKARRQYARRQFDVVEK